MTWLAILGAVAVALFVDACLDPDRRGAFVAWRRRRAKRAIREAEAMIESAQRISDARREALESRLPPRGSAAVPRKRSPSELIAAVVDDTLALTRGPAPKPQPGRRRD